MGAVLVVATLPDGSTVRRVFRSPYHAVTDLSAAIAALGINEPVVEGGHHFLVKAEVWHKITALMDDTEFDCVYSHHTPQGDIVQEWTGWLKATY